MISGATMGSGIAPQIIYPSTSQGAQTWPVRALDKKHKNADVKALRSLLGNPNNRNVWADFHGSPESFAESSVQQLKSAIKQRYRFAFLDGCHTAHGPLRAFGLLDWEMRYTHPSWANPDPRVWYCWPQNTFPGDVSVPDPDITPYFSHNVRPAAFIGWNMVTPMCVPCERTVDSRTGLTCNQKQDSSLCNWRCQFIFAWTFQDCTLFEAIVQADLLAMPNNKAYPLADPEVIAFGYNIATTSFTTRNAIEVFGFGGMYINQYNQESYSFP